MTEMEVPVSPDERVKQAQGGMSGAVQHGMADRAVNVLEDTLNTIAKAVD